MAVFAVVLAGGRGRRLWPLSRSGRPKQFLPLLDGRTPLEETLARLAAVIPPERILVVAEHGHGDLALPLLPPGARLVREPCGRGTAPALGLAALHIRAREPGAAVAAVPADNWVAPGSDFAGDLRAAIAQADAGWLALVGTEPSRPAAGCGYIRPGRSLRSAGDRPAFRAEGFVEKPDRPQAERLWAEGWLWNAGVFAFRPVEFLEELRQLQPGLAGALARVEAALGTVNYEAVLEEAWRDLDPVSLEEGFFARGPRRLAVIRGTHRWLDLGTWDAVRRISLPCERANAVSGDALVIKSQGCLVRAGGGRLVAAIGVRGLTIVDTPDALLVLGPDCGEEVRMAAEALAKERPGLG